MSKYEAKFICGYCNKVTPMTDAQCERSLDPAILKSTIGPISFYDCGHRSYASSIRCKLMVDKKNWRGFYGSSN